MSQSPTSGASACGSTLVAQRGVPNWHNSSAHATLLGSGCGAAAARKLLTAASNSAAELLATACSPASVVSSKPR